VPYASTFPFLYDPVGFFAANTAAYISTSLILAETSVWLLLNGRPNHKK
jgi:hypothetical protein